MEIAGKKLITKAGAEGFQGTGLCPDAIAGNSCGYGLAVKVAEGDISGNFRLDSESAEGRVRPIVTLEALQQIGALTDDEIVKLNSFGPRAQYNWRHREVGSFSPCFSLQEHSCSQT